MARRSLRARANYPDPSRPRRAPHRARRGAPRGVREAARARDGSKRAARESGEAARPRRRGPLRPAAASSSAQRRPRVTAPRRPRVSAPRRPRVSCPTAFTRLPDGVARLRRGGSERRTRDRSQAGLGRPLAGRPAWISVPDRPECRLRRRPNSPAHVRGIRGRGAPPSRRAGNGLPIFRSRVVFDPTKERQAYSDNQFTCPGLPRVPSLPDRSEPPGSRSRTRLLFRSFPMRSSLVRRIVPSWLALALVWLVAAAQPVWSQTLTSDKEDYQPGETAVLTGSGFAPNEMVTMLVMHIDGSLSLGPAHDPWYVDADVNGNFMALWECLEDCR